MYANWPMLKSFFEKVFLIFFVLMEDGHVYFVSQIVGNTDIHKKMVVDV